MVSTPTPTQALPTRASTTAMVVCGTILACFVIAALVYLEVRGQSTMALTALVLQVPGVIVSTLAYYYSRRSDARGQVISNNVNGTLRHQTEVANLALAELHPRAAAKVIDAAHAAVPDVAGASPADEQRT